LVGNETNQINCLRIALPSHKAPTIQQSSPGNRHVLARLGLGG
jgi:hypothetical protein